MHRTTSLSLFFSLTIAFFITTACSSSSGGDDFQTETKNLTVTSLSLVDSQGKAEVNHSFSLSVGLDAPEETTLVPITFYALSSEQVGSSSCGDGVAIGGYTIEKAASGTSQYEASFVVTEEAIGLEGFYEIYAIVDQLEEITEENENDNCSLTQGITTTAYITSQKASTPVVSITSVELGLDSQILGDEEELGEDYAHVDGTVHLNVSGPGSDTVTLSFCMVGRSPCEAVSVMDQTTGEAATQITAGPISSNQDFSVGFELLLSADQYQWILNNLQESGLPVSFMVNATLPVEGVFSSAQQPFTAYFYPQLDSDTTSNAEQASKASNKIYADFKAEKSKNWWGDNFGVKPGLSSRSYVSCTPYSANVACTHYVEQGFSAPAKIFKQINIAKFTSKGILSVGKGSAKRTLEFTLFGIRVVSLSAPLSAGVAAGWEDDVALGYNSPKIDKGIGPFRIKVEAKAGLIVGGQAKVKTDFSELAVVIGPTFKVGAAAEAKAGCGKVSLGVSGELNLFSDELSLNLRATPKIDSENVQRKLVVTVSSDLTNTIDGPNGEIKLTAKAWFVSASLTLVKFFTTDIPPEVLAKFFDKKWEYNL